MLVEPTGIVGNFDINTNKFTVDATTGNTSIAGTMQVNGASTLSSTLDVTGATGIDGNFDINTNKFTVDRNNWKYFQLQVLWEF